MSEGIKIAYFPSNTERDKVLKYNGLVLDNYCISAKSAENIENATYTLDAVFIFNESIKDYLQEEAILKVREDYGDEVFRIIKVTKTTRRITIVANQETIPQCKQLWLKDVRPTNQNGIGALQWMYSNAEGRKELFINSNISNLSSANYQKKNLQEAIYGGDNSFISKWGGETLRRGYTLTIDDSIGAERGVTIREAKNLIGFECATNLDDLVTRAVGQGYNGLMGNYIDSPIINNYANVYTKVIEYSNVKVKGTDTVEDDSSIYFNTEEEAIAYLDELVKKEFEENNIDKIKATYTINFVQLEKNEEYKDYVQAERVYLGDTIRVYIPRLNMDIKVRAVEKVYDVMAQKTEEITVSNTSISSRMSASSIINSIKDMLNTTGNLDLSSYIDATIKAGMKGSYIIVRDGELLAMDSKDVNSAINVTRLNKNGLGFSSTGYYGEYTYGFTLDGKINASLISTGILSTILIQNADGSFKIDLSGTGGASFYNNNVLAMRMESSQLKFYNWADNGDYIGSLGSTTMDNNSTRCLISLWNDYDSALSIGYKSGEHDVNPYFRCDKYGVIDDNTSVTIKAFENLGLCNYSDLMFFGRDHRVPLGVLALSSSNNMFLCTGKEADNRTLNLGAIKDDDMSSFETWVLLDKNRVKFNRPISLEITKDGSTGYHMLNACITDIYERLAALETT